MLRIGPLYGVSTKGFNRGRGVTSLFDQAIADGCDRAFAKAIAPDGWLRKQIRKHVNWHMQGFEPGYGLKEREAFTQTVADRIHEKAREPLSLFGFRLWKVRCSPDWCAEEAEQIVTDWLDDERIKFGDSRFYWKDGADIADEAMSYWDA